MSLSAYRSELNALKNPTKAKLLSGFFKTGKGQYGEGDVFLGITVPLQRKVAKKYPNLSLDELASLLSSPIHEYRLGALIILVGQYEKAKKKKDEKTQKQIYEFFLKHARLGHVNNWDLVDATTPKIVGHFLWENPIERKILLQLARSPNLWERRIAMLATFWFIKNGDFGPSIRLASSLPLLTDRHDLMHKATGWMLREVGKKDEKVLRAFLDEHAKKMPRTALRYSIERLSEKDRKRYLSR